MEFCDNLADFNTYVNKFETISETGVLYPNLGTIQN